MSLNVPVPDSPPLSGPTPGGAYNAVSPPEEEGVEDYYRDELESVLEAGAWAEGFEEWTAGTDLSESEFDLVVRHGLIDQLDFYWDPVTEAVDYHVPSLSDDVHEALAADSDADDVESELDSLARTVSELLENDYLVRDEDRFGFFAE